MNHYEDLLQAFGIRTDDLEANRAGRLGNSQRRQLLSSGNSNMVGAFLIGIVLGAILYGVADKPLVPIQWILYILLSAIVLIVGFRYFRQTRADVAGGQVECLVGPVRVVSRGRAGWYLTMADQSFRLPIRPWHIQQNNIYRVYIAPNTRIILAMEPVADKQ